MDRRLKIAAAAVVALPLLGLGGFAVFEHFEQAEVKAQAEEPCPAPPAGGMLPLDLPATEGLTLRRVDEQGRTVAVFEDAPGTRQDVETVRDRVLADLTAAGYRVVDTESEKGIEAEAEVAGPHEGTLLVKPLCTGTLEVRYALER